MLWSSLQKLEAFQEARQLSASEPAWPRVCSFRTTGISPLPNVLSGLAGNDTLNGGSGNDLFKYNLTSDSPSGTDRDLINSFAGAGTALGDQIDLTAIEANTVVTGNQAFSWLGSRAFTVAGQFRYAGGVLQGNTDANVTTIEIEIQLVGAPALSVGGTGTDILL